MEDACDDLEDVVFLLGGELHLVETVDGLVEVVGLVVGVVGEVSLLEVGVVGEGGELEGG